MSGTSDSSALLLELGCEEIPARMIRAAAEDLARRVGKIVAEGGLGHGDVRETHRRAGRS